MKTHFKTLAILAALALATSVQAQVTLNRIGVGSATDFPAFSISGLNGTLAFESIGTTPAGATIAGGASQGANIANVTGEIFNWTGPNSILSAISIIDMGAAGGDTYQPFLFDLGTGIYNLPSLQFNPSIQTDLFSDSDSITMPALGSKNFVELDLTGSDQITLVTGQSYAFGLALTSGSANLNFERASGAQSDPNGDGYTFANFASTADNAAPYSGSVRNEFIGVYTTPVPEPSSMVLMGLGILVGGMLIRRRQKA